MREVWLFRDSDGSEVFVEVFDGRMDLMQVATRPDNSAVWGPPLEFVRREKS